MAKTGFLHNLEHRVPVEISPSTDRLVYKARCRMDMRAAVDVASATYSCQHALGEFSLDQASDGGRMWPIVLGSAFITFLAIKRLTQFKVNPGLVTFPCEFPLPDSVERLALACLPYQANTLVFRWLVGDVSKAYVKLTCRTRQTQNAFKPVFRGYFSEEDGKPVLKGTFSMAASVRIVMFFWSFALLCVLGLLGSQLGAHHGPDQLSDMFGVAAVLALGILTMRNGVNSAADDIEWISKTIRTVLQPSCETQPH